MKSKKVISNSIFYILVFLVCVIILYPYFVMTITSLKGLDEMYAAEKTVLPIVSRWSNFIDIWKEAPVFNYFSNSIIISLGSTLLSIICGIPAAYALSRMEFKGKALYLGAIVASQMFAPVVLIVGIYKLMVDMSLVNSLFGLILVNAAFSQAFTVWLLRGTFVSISPEMENAALIDGCTQVEAVRRILLPMAAPGIVTAMIYVFIDVWNEYTIALTLISTENLKPISVGINIFSSYNTIQWQYLFATSIFATIPVIVLFLCIEKYLVSGLTSGGVKE